MIRQFEKLLQTQDNQAYKEQNSPMGESVIPHGNDDLLNIDDDVNPDNQQNADSDDETQPQSLG